MAVASLSEGAVKAAGNLFVLFAAGTLKAKTLAFWQSLLPLFPEQDPSGRPVADWLTLIADLSSRLDTITAGGTYGQLDQMTDYVYRLCFLTSQLRTQNLITAPQSAAVLAAYNLQFT